MAFCDIRNMQKKFGSKIFFQTTFYQVLCQFAMNMTFGGKAT